MSLPAYRNHVRLTQARQALRSRRSLAEVAALMGFADQANFTLQFKLSIGITPGRYRAQV
jgi:AraC-like DNA-binding protein